MRPPESEASEFAVRNLREQVRTLESIVLHQRAAIEECRSKLEVFETAATERLQVIERGDRLLRARAEEIESGRIELDKAIAKAEALTRELVAKEATNAKELARLERACRETARGMDELAERERSLTQENVVLRNQGLLHSIIVRISRVFS